MNRNEQIIKTFNNFKLPVYEEIPDVLGSGSDFREYGTYNSFEEAMDKYNHSCANTIHKRTKTYKDGKLDIKTEYWDNETKSFRQ